MKKLLILALLGATLLPFACKKYEEGPWLSLRSAKNRFYGKHLLTKYTVNGIDSLDLYNDSLGVNFRFYYDDIAYENICSIDGNRKDGHTTKVQWNWRLNNNNKIFQQIYSVGDAGTGPFGENKNNIDWKILRLTSKEIDMKTYYQEKEYIIELKTI